MNLQHLGLLKPQHPPRVLAPAPPQSRPVTAAESAHVTMLLAACLNVEECARFLATTPRFSGQLRLELAAIGKAARNVNARFLAEFHAADAKAVDTLNSMGNLLNRLAILMASSPPAVAEAAANAAGSVVQQWANPPKPRAARRVKPQPQKQAA